jgi:uncharacterized protein YjbI with pentapeptide repeats/beta-lactamase regulating signal transducer with metallopeptidase domain
MTALVGNVVWACLAGLAVALVIAGVVGAIVRVQRPAAATRYALWFVAFAVCAFAPVAIVGTMLARGIDRPAVAGTPSVSATGTTSNDGTSVRDDGASRGAAPSAAAATQPALHALAGATRALRRPPSFTRRIALAIVLVWAVVAMAGLAGLARSLYRVHALKARSSPLEGSLADDLPWLTETAGREIYLRLSYEIETPIAVGFRRPVILIPTDMATADGLAAIDSLVMHEYAHLARYDDWTNLAQRFIERVAWFNPLVWYVGRRIALEREVAADDAVVARTNDAKNYASTLWRMAREMRMPEHVVVAPGAMLTRKQISIRIERLLEESRGRRPQAGTAFLALAIGACTVGAVAASAPPIVFPAAAPPAPVAVDVTTPAPLDASQPVAAPARLPSDDAHPSPAPHAVVAPHVAAAPAVAAGPPVAAVSPVAAVPPVAPAPPVAIPDPTLPPDFEQGLAQAAQRAADASVRAAEAMKRAVALAPHTPPAGDLTRELVAACRTCDFSHRDLSGLDLSHLDFYGADFDGANLSNVDFTGARLTGVSMRNANLSGADFTNARLIGSRLQGADFDHTDFSNAKFVGSSVDLSALHANGSLRAMVDGCTGCNFANADLHGQDFHGLRLDGANLSSTDLHGANLRGAHLVGANLQDANLDRADLRDANLTGANLSGASMDGTLTANAVLMGAALP